MTSHPLPRRKRKAVKFENHAEAYLKKKYPQVNGWNLIKEYETVDGKRSDFYVSKDRTRIAVEAKNVSELQKSHIEQLDLDASAIRATDRMMCIPSKTKIKNKGRKQAKELDIKIVRLWGF